MTIGIITNKQGKSVFLEQAFMASPTTSVASQFKIGSGQVLLETGSTDLTNPVYFTGTQTYEDFTIGFPTIATSGAVPEVTINCRVGASQATTESLNAMGIFNTDDTPKMLIQMNHTAESKSPTDEFVYVIRTRVL